MCYAVKYYFNGKIFADRFARRHSKLPVLDARGELRFFPWGRHREESGQLPLGGWVWRDRITAGLWDPFYPHFVTIPAVKFMERDFEDRSYWFDIVPGQCIEGVMASFNTERRVYIATLLPERFDTVFGRWPYLINTL